MTSGQRSLNNNNNHYNKDNNNNNNNILIWNEMNRIVSFEIVVVVVVDEPHTNIVTPTNQPNEEKWQMTIVIQIFLSYLFVLFRFIFFFINRSTINVEIGKKKFFVLSCLVICRHHRWIFQINDSLCVWLKSCCCFSLHIHSFHISSKKSLFV